MTFADFIGILSVSTEKELNNLLLSDTIASFIDKMLDDCGGTLEIKRNDLAKKLGCVPSQINYVIATRFSPERGYMVESRRGGGG